MRNALEKAAEKKLTPFGAFLRILFVLVFGLFLVLVSAYGILSPGPERIPSNPAIGVVIDSMCVFDMMFFAALPIWLRLMMPD